MKPLIYTAHYSQQVLTKNKKLFQPQNQKTNFSGIHYVQDDVVNDTYKHIEETLNDYASLSDLLKHFNSTSYTLKISQGVGQKAGILTLSAYNKDATPSKSIDFGVRNINKEVAPKVKTYLLSALEELNSAMLQDFSGIISLISNEG